MSTSPTDRCPACGGPTRGRLLLPIDHSAVQAFAELVAAIARRDWAAGRRCLAALRAAGFIVCATRPKGERRRP